ncbi:MAG: hypothetical protein M0008_06345 [Actinomycetota bacterium]|nr:hypothetical protein [Actinomycetota bacterium]
MTTPDFKEWVERLTVPDLAQWLTPTHSDIDSVAYVLNVDPHYLSAQVRLHIPFYSSEDIQNTPAIVLVRKILHDVRSELEKFALVHAIHRELNGSQLVEPGTTLVTRDGHLEAQGPRAEPQSVEFGPVPRIFGEQIQRQIHYIHQVRDDTEFHLGLRFSEYVGPFCYAAFSPLDRRYLRQALRTSVGSAFDDGADRVAVMTRAYGYTPTPKNSMSKLFDLCARQLRDAGYNWIITAINPFLGFKGSIFSGASYFPFATSPMRYTYTPNGTYIPRRAGAGTVPQQLDVPPILWLARPLGPHTTRRLQKATTSVYNVSQHEYDAG